MSRTVLCRKYKKEMEGMARPPYPGPQKAKNYSRPFHNRPGAKWQKHQTMLINEKHLNMRDPEARQFLQEQMEKFFVR